MNVKISDRKIEGNRTVNSWEKIPNLKIISMSYNQNNTLLVLGTNYGYRILDVLHDFQIISTVNESQKELGL